MIPNEEGKYIARPRVWGVDYSKNNAVEFAVDFTLSQWHNDAAGEWQDVSASGLSIIGYFYPIDSKGQLVDMTCESLKESLHWSGNSLAELQNTDWTQVEVQLVLQREEYQGRTTMKVKFINPRDYAGGGVKQADPQAILAMDQRFGATLRANSKAKPGLAAKPPVTTPANGNGTPPITEAEKERRLAYSQMRKMFATMPDTAFKEHWKTTVAHYFHNKPQLQVSAAEWQKFSADDFDRKPENPISEEPVYSDDDIPFESAPAR